MDKTTATIWKLLAVYWICAGIYFYLRFSQ